MTGAPASSDDRLDSWKEIAAFLHRDVRTVQRWEKHAGLPVHRHRDARLRCAYAFRSELDAWRSAHDGMETAAPPGAVSNGRTAAGLRTGMVLALCATAAAGLAGGISWRAWSDRRADTPPAAPVGVVVSSIVDETGDAALAGSVQEIVGRELFRQPAVAVMSPARVTSALELMRVHGQFPLTPAAAREVAVRDGGAAFVIAGRTRRTGLEIRLDLQALDARDGGVRISVERALTGGRSGSGPIGADRIAEAAALLAAKVAAAGAQPPERLERVTTASLPALRLYTSAVAAAERRQWGAAEALARRAIAADAEFASAYALLGWGIRQQGRARGEALAWFDRARALSYATSDRETYWIAGVYHAAAGDLAEAIAAFEALLRLAPGDRNALDQLTQVYSRAGRIDDAIALAVSRAKQAPDDFYANVRAAQALMIWKQDRALAAPYIQRARQLASPQTAAERPSWSAWLATLPAFEAWLRADVRGTAAMLAPLARGVDARIGRERDALATSVGFAYASIGDLRLAEQAFRHAATPVRQAALAQLALGRDDVNEAARRLRQVKDSSRVSPALFASAGLIGEAQDGLAHQTPSDYEEGSAAVTEGLLAARRGQTGAAVALLRKGVERLQCSGEPEYFLGVSELARLLRARGDTDGAVAWLTQAAAQRARTYGSIRWTGWCWVQINRQLASLYRELGRRADAETIDAALAPLLAARRDEPSSAPFQLARRR